MDFTIEAVFFRVSGDMVPITDAIFNGTGITDLMVPKHMGDNEVMGDDVTIESIRLVGDSIYTIRMMFK